ncbi:MAG: UbiA family prenyltransferase [Promethearchaeota archaeon]
MIKIKCTAIIEHAVIKILNGYIKLFRFNQWYKNLLFFIGFLFERKFFNIEVFPRVILAFAFLCAFSSINYIINDLVDVEADKQSPIKRNPLVHEELSKRYIFLIIASLLVTSFAISYLLFPRMILYYAIFLIVGQLYNFYLKSEAILDMLALVTLYLIRVFAGYEIISVKPSLLIVIPISFIACFLMLIKKKTILNILGQERATIFRKNYEFYSKSIVNKLLMLFQVAIAASYLYYVFFSEKFNKLLLISSYPIAILLLYYFNKFTSKNQTAGIFIWQCLKDKKILVSVSLILIIYLVNFLFF